MAAGREVSSSWHRSHSARAPSLTLRTPLTGNYFRLELVPLFLPFVQKQIWIKKYKKGD